jgi:hypothetical protein
MFFLLAAGGGFYTGHWIFGSLMLLCLLRL